MAVDVAGFRIRYPEFTDPPYTDALIESRIEDATCDFSRSKLSASACGDNIYCRIIYALAAHNLTLWNKTQKGSITSGGSISSKTVGKVSVSYSLSSSAGSTEDFYKQTLYGSDYLMLLKKYCPAIMTIC